MNHRIEKDSLGEQEIPNAVYWGIHTQRAILNFQISRTKVPFCLIRALAKVKKAACLANWELGYLDDQKADGIIRACDEISSGRLEDQFPLDAYQGGAGTSTNMNVNEVVANRALEILGKSKGDYSWIHPIEHVNLHQSTNDVYPTALKVAAMFLFQSLSSEIASLQGIFQQKEKEFAEIVKIGRTEMQEAVPMTLGAQFSAFAEAFGRDRWRVFKCEERLRVVNLGGTAIGTGLGAPKSYIFLVIEKLREVTSLGLCRSENTVDGTSNADAFVEVSGILKAHAANLIKAANDLRLMNLLGEIRLPKIQAGSSIMPGKVNPVVLEAVVQTAQKVIANDFLITQSAALGSFQIVEWMPLLSLAILDSLELLTNVNSVFREHVSGISADAEKCQLYFRESPALVTAFLPYIGYERAGALLKKFEAAKLEKNAWIHFLERELGEELVAQVLSPENLTKLGH